MSLNLVEAKSTRQIENDGQQEKRNTSANSKGSGQFKMLLNCGDDDDEEDYDKCWPKLKIGNGNGMRVVGQRTKNRHQDAVAEEEQKNQVIKLHIFRCNLSY
jgi:hypothetical protein